MSPHCATAHALSNRLPSTSRAGSERKETVMSAITWRRGRAVLAVGAVLSLGVVGAVGAATAANAASIDTAQQGSIIVHKFENPGNGAANPDGTGTLPTTKPIPGVVFEYCPI